MKEGGWILVVSGVAIAIVALALIPTSVEVPAVEGYLSSSREVHNLGRLQNRELVFLGGCTTFLAGMVLVAAGSIIDAITGAGRRGSAIVVDEAPFQATAPAGTTAAMPVAVSTTRGEQLVEYEKVDYSFVSWSIGGVLVFAALIAIIALWIGKSSVQ